LVQHEQKQEVDHYMKAAINDDKRLLSLDVFRGIAIAGMIIVNNQGDWGNVYPAFRHAAWHGWYGADIVFPFFLFAVGASLFFTFTHIVSSGAPRNVIFQRVIRRTIILIALGLLLNLFPFFDFSTMRIPGVLQRIGLCYFFAAVLVLHTGPKTRMAVTLFLLILYSALLMCVTQSGFGRGSLEPCCNLPGFIDSVVFPGHTYGQAPVPGFDPEGLLTTIPSIASTMIGVFAASMLHDSIQGTMKKWLIPGAGAALIVAGLALNTIIPINKNLWTPSYCLFMGGLAILVFALCHYLCDNKRYRHAFIPFIILGRNAIAAYLLSSIMGKAIISISIAIGNTAVPLKTIIVQSLFTSWLEPAAASLLYALCFLLIWIFVMYLLYRKQIFISI
jgi:predicted acyltransferase